MGVELGNQSNLRIVLAGSVMSTRWTLAGLLRHNMNLVGVLGLSGAKSGSVSGYDRISQLPAERGIEYCEFENINDHHVLKQVSNWRPDVLFVVGLSQIVRGQLLGIPRLGCVGFHPTRLPKGRGRAPISWILLDKVPAAATFFEMNEGIDSGPILVQEPFDVNSEDYASDVIRRLQVATDRALDRLLPELSLGHFSGVPQSENEATYYGRRAPEDGLIDWALSAASICLLVRASSRPYPGAFTFVKGRKLSIWRARVEDSSRFKGVPGRLLDHKPSQGWLVQTGEGLAMIEEWEFAPSGVHGNPDLRIGTKLGIDLSQMWFLQNSSERSVTYEP